MVNIFESDEDEEEVSDEDMVLLELGMIPDHFNKFEGKNFIYQGRITKKGLEWYLKRVTEKQLEAIRIDKLTEKQQKMVQKKLDNGIEAFKEPEVNTIEDYIEYNQNLITENTKLKESLLNYINLHKQGKEYVEKYQKEIKELKDKSQKVIDGVEVMETNQDLFKILGWLYGFMDTKMFLSTTLITCPECKHEFDMVKGEDNIVVPRDIRMLEEIEEVLGK